MEMLGVWLRQTREAEGNTLEEVEIATRIRPRFLAALEASDFSAFSGGEVQVRGFLRIYARYLDLSPDEVLARYDTEIHGAHVASPSVPAETYPASPTRPATRSAPFQLRSTPPRPSAVNLTTLVIVGLAIIVL
ncbi:MAG: helix-turn-helix domain-containing protein, partial [Anaerolineae bacterium]